MKRPCIKGQLYLGTNCFRYVFIASHNVSLPEVNMAEKEAVSHVRSEDELSQKFDRCLSDATIKFGMMFV